MLILMSDGAGLTSRQAATVLARAGHQVEALSPPGLCLCRMTRHVRRVHDVPPVGRDPFGWLDAALGIAGRRGADVLLPVQEQVAVMALGRDRIEAAGLATAVPSFTALAQVQDKVSAYRTLARLGVPQPPAVIAASAAELTQAAGRLEAGAETQLRLPAFVKTPIGTASAGVRRVSSPEEMRRLAADWERQGAFGQGGVLVQQPVPGPLRMVQSVFAGGELVAFHACERVREGAAGGSSHKLGRQWPQARAQLARLGAALGWHGALSADVIDGPDGPMFIDINPRLVEPANALAAGVDLAGALVEVATAGTSRPQPDGAPGARTHQLLLAVLRAAQGGRRRDVARELADAARRRGTYRGSQEELTPGGGDLLAPVPVAVAALATLISPPAWRWFVGGSAGAYSLTPAAWGELTTTARALVAPAPWAGPGEVVPGRPVNQSSSGISGLAAADQLDSGLPVREQAVPDGDALRVDRAESHPSGCRWRSARHQVGVVLHWISQEGRICGPWRRQTGATGRWCDTQASSIPSGRC